MITGLPKALSIAPVFFPPSPTPVASPIELPPSSEINLRERQWWVVAVISYALFLHCIPLYTILSGSAEKEHYMSRVGVVDC